MGPGGAPVAVPVRDGRLGPPAAAVGRTLALHRLEQGHRGTTHYCTMLTLRRLTLLFKVYQGTGIV